jgi:hypothetical protein
MAEVVTTGVVDCLGQVARITGRVSKERIRYLRK